jgi:hypothetical protein
MEAIMTSGFTDEVLSESAPAYSGFTGTTPPQELFETTKRDLPFGIREKIAHRHLREARQQRRYWASLDIVAESADNEQIFDVIQSLYLSENRPRDRQIATRITALYRDALTEDECILSTSLRQFANFFLAHPDLGVPRITLTPDGTLRARWIQGAGNFTAIEFTGEPLAKFVAEIPREGGLTARYFSVEPVDKILSFTRAIGASFV